MHLTRQVLGRRSASEGAGCCERAPCKVALAPAVEKAEASEFSHLRTRCCACALRHREGMRVGCCGRGVAGVLQERASTSRKSSMALRCESWERPFSEPCVGFSTGTCVAGDTGWGGRRERYSMLQPGRPPSLLGAASAAATYKQQVGSFRAAVCLSLRGLRRCEVDNSGRRPKTAWLFLLRDAAPPTT